MGAHWRHWFFSSLSLHPVCGGLTSVWLKLDQLSRIQCDQIIISRPLNTCQKFSWLICSLNKWNLCYCYQNYDSLLVLMFSVLPLQIWYMKRAKILGLQCIVAKPLKCPLIEGRGLSLINNIRLLLIIAICRIDMLYVDCL